MITGEEINSAQIVGWIGIALSAVSATAIATSFLSTKIDTKISRTEYEEKHAILRNEANMRSDIISREANTRADTINSEANRRADLIMQTINALDDSLNGRIRALEMWRAAMEGRIYKNNNGER